MPYSPSFTIIPASTIDGGGGGSGGRGGDCSSAKSELLKKIKIKEANMVEQKNKAGEGV